MRLQRTAQASAANDEQIEARSWFTAAELADQNLPGLPGDKRSINRRAQDERWSARVDADGAMLVRPRSGRGGGLEFHVSLLPGPAQIELAKRGLIEAPQSDERTAPSNSWDWFATQPDTVREEAERRLAAIEDIDMMIAGGATKSAAIGEVSTKRKIGQSTLWNWRRAVEGIPASDRLPALAPRRPGGGRKAEMDEELWTIFKSDYLRAAEPTLASCYRRIEAVAAERGLSVPSEKSLRRRLEREIDPGVLKLRRKGEEALRRSMPALRRTVEHLHALEYVNIDGHKWDVWVQPPEGSGTKPIRPMMVAIQDVRSSKVLAWRIGESESTALARLAFADLFREYGIPVHAVLDNGRGFASKWLTGGARTRFRFKIRDEDPTGLLTALGIQIHWALPFRGQSKPIERAFRDMASDIARAPEAEGAYTGNSPTNKPHNYGTRAMEWDAFQRLVAKGIADHNARLGRKGRDYGGRSFDEVFAASYASAPIGKARPEQMRMALLAAEQKRVNRQTGEIALFGNRYWAVECSRLHGELVTVRFDPDNLHSEIHVYAQDGRFLFTASVIEDQGFDSAEGARLAKKRWADLRKRTREGLEAERLLSADMVADQMPTPENFTVPEPGALRLVSSRRTAGDIKRDRDAAKARIEAEAERENRLFGAIGKIGAPD